MTCGLIAFCVLGCCLFCVCMLFAGLRFGVLDLVILCLFWCLFCFGYVLLACVSGVYVFIIQGRLVLLLFVRDFVFEFLVWCCLWLLVLWICCWFGWLV